jgi:hypothetical protein
MAFMETSPQGADAHGPPFANTPGAADSLPGPKCRRTRTLAGTGLEPAAFETASPEKDMKLKGSCHCGAVRFSVRSSEVYPYQLCYCSICRKTQGGTGAAINLAGEAVTLKVTGRRNLGIYRALVKNPEDRRGRRSTGQRHFCRKCGAALWLYDPAWPALVHPFASAIDTPLPKPPRRTHIMLEFKPAWVETHARQGDRKFQRYPKQSIADWHEELAARRKK